MRTAEEWTQRTIERNAALVLGWRKGSTVAAGRLSLAREMNQELRQRAAAALSEIGRRTVRTYDPAAQLEDDEVFLLTIDALPARRRRRRPGPPPRPGNGDPPDDGDPPDEQHEASELIQLLQVPGDLDPIAPEDREGRLFFSTRLSSAVQTVRWHS